MIAQADPVLVRAYPSLLEMERRHGDRVECHLDATTRPLDSNDTLAWGGAVKNISSCGIGLTLCYPFRAGTYLAVEVHGIQSDAPGRMMLARVAHVRDLRDGSWYVGCELLKPLSHHELDELV